MKAIKLDFMEKFDEALAKREKKVQVVETMKDLDLLNRFEDVLLVKRTKYPKVAPEYFLFAGKGKNNLILWGTSISSHGKNGGRVIKIPLTEISAGSSPLEIKDYSNKYFDLKERSFSRLHDAGLLY